MKPVRLLFAIACLLMVVCSCRKDRDADLYGKWRLVATCGAYANGGSFTWMDVPAGQSHTLELTEDGYYSEQVPGGNTCTGTYRQLPGNELEILSTCQTVPVKVKISQLTRNTLIIDHPVIEGVIREKYTSAH